MELSYRRAGALALGALTVAVALGELLGLAPHPSPGAGPPGGEGLPTPRVALAGAPEIAQRATVVGYERARFGAGWARHGPCTTREHVIETQWPGTTREPGGCRLSGPVAPDPYSGETTEVGDLDVDHVVPLSAAWDLGAHVWDDETRVRFANDPLNLVAVSARENRAKGDALPAEWMPPDKQAHCWYATRVAAVSATYDLPLPAADLRVLRRACHSGR